MFVKVREITSMADYWLHAIFEDGAARQYDVKPLFDKWAVFNDLKRDGLFERVRIDEGGYGIVWNDEIDLSGDELYWNGVPV